MCGAGPKRRLSCFSSRLSGLMRALKRVLALHAGALPGPSWPLGLVSRRAESRDRDEQKRPEGESQGGGFHRTGKRHGTSVGCGGERGGCSEIWTRIPLRDVQESHTHICLKLHFWWLKCSFWGGNLFYFACFRHCSETEVCLGCPASGIAIFLEPGL